VTSPLTIEIVPESSRPPLSSMPLLDSILFYGLVGLLMFGPLAFGAVETWSIWILQVGASLLFVLWAMRQTMAGELEIIGNPLFLPMLVFGALVVLQLVAGRTAYRAETFSTGLLYCAYGAIAFLAIQRLHKTPQLRILAWVFSVYGFTIAMFALIHGITSNGKLYWLRTPQLGGWIYGPYVNHNHYAGLMEMLAPIPLVISLTSSVRRSHRALAALAAAVMVSTIFLSGSRGGMIAFAAQLLALATFLLKRRKNSKALFALQGFVVIAIAMLAWLGGGVLVQRIASFHSTAQAEISGGTRLSIDRDGLRMFTQKPLLGWGLGVFPEVYPQFRSFPSDQLVDRAHNDYLQVLVEMGAVGFAVVLWFLLMLYHRGLKNLRNWPADANSAMTLAALLGVSGILVHSFVDFNLQIPANAVLFYVLCVMAVMKPSFSLHRRPRRHRHHHSHELPRDRSIPATVSIG
jgi:O-antigen ligase